MHRTLLLILLLLLAPAASVADDPLACVDPELVRAFISNEYSTTVPADMAHIDVPAGFSLVGSRTNRSTTTVAYRTASGAEGAIAAAVSLLEESGWVENGDRRYSGRGGFQSDTRSARAVVCRDDAPNPIDVNARPDGDVTFVSYTRHPRSSRCQPRAQPGEDLGARDLFFYLPVLALPEDAIAANVSTGGGGDEVNTRVDISGAAGRTDLLNFFEDQIRKQNWQHQTGWSSRVSSGSVWLADTEEAGTLVGTLHVFDAGEDPVRVRFSINPADPKRGVERGRWSRITH